MSFFNNKPKITRAAKGDMTTFNISCYKAKAPEKFKAELLGRIFPAAPALAVIDTSFMYKEQKYNFLNDQQKLLEQLDSAAIDYRRIAVTRKEEMNIFGLNVRRGEGKTYQDYIIGLIIDPGAVEAVLKLTGSYSLYYYFDCGTTNAEELLDKFEALYADDEKLKAQFQYYIFDDNFMGNMVVYCKEQAADHISSMLV